MHEIPALIKEMSDDLVQEAALIENIQRENLNPVEEAITFKAILKNNNSDYDKLSSTIGKSKSHISNIIRLLELDEEILKEANLEGSETVLALTNDDENNMMACVLAEKTGMKKRTIAIVNKTNYN